MPNEHAQWKFLDNEKFQLTTICVQATWSKEQLFKCKWLLNSNPKSLSSSMMIILNVKYIGEKPYQ